MKPSAFRIGKHMNTNYGISALVIWKVTKPFIKKNSIINICYHSVLCIHARSINVWDGIYSREGFENVLKILNFILLKAAEFIITVISTYL